MKRAESKRVHDALEQEVKQNTFLAEWFKESEADRIMLEEHEFSWTTEQWETLAISNGFRTERQFKSSFINSNELLRMYLHEPAFQTLWKRLRELDESRLVNTSIVNAVHEHHRNGVGRRRERDVRAGLA